MKCRILVVFGVNMQGTNPGGIINGCMLESFDFHAVFSVERQDLNIDLNILPETFIWGSSYFRAFGLIVLTSSYEFLSMNR